MPIHVFSVCAPFPWPHQIHTHSDIGYIPIYRVDAGKVRGHLLCEVLEYFVVQVLGLIS